ncbi:Uptake hydrogenase small subunit precursor [hydrothermal vent metagenome]|uniref:Uptake hydrogenase small subunit n=1 Tax=hydrothermal vent metagenome TaxID=652676 RepID=A0A1W1D0Q8_9ZZZZ
MKKPKLLWLQSISCNGDAHSFFNHPDFFSILSNFELIHHPLLDTNHNFDELLAMELECDILLLDGSFRERGFSKGGIEVFALIEHYAKKAKWIVTVGTCATFGGVFKEADPENISGFCFDKEEKTSRYDTYASKLISLSGCPIHPKWLSYVLIMLLKKKKIPLDEFHRPQELYATTVHQGCTRNEYFEWKIDAENFGLKEGCLFYEQGCQAPYTHGSCNKILWNDVSSKTVSGIPCFGCTEPTFPKTGLFKTKTNMGIPAKVPLGISKRAYFTATGVVKSFRIKRFEKRLIDYDN